MPRKKFTNMTVQELAEATREFDEEGVADAFRPMTPAEELGWLAARRRPRGRANVGEGRRVISLGIDADLLRRADALAKRRGISRAKLMAAALELMLARSDAEPPERE